MTTSTSDRTGTGSDATPVDLQDHVTAQRPFRLARHSFALAGRSVTLIKRNPEALIDVTLTPIIFLLLFVYLFGGAIADGDRGEYLNFVLPAVLLQTLVFCATYIGVNLNTDITKGVFDRFRSLPIPRSAPLVGAVLGVRPARPRAAHPAERPGPLVPARHAADLRQRLLRPGRLAPRLPAVVG